METIESLYEVISIKRQINSLYIKRDMILSGILPSGIRYDKDAVQTSPDGDMFADLFAEEAEVNEKISTLCKMLPEAIKRVDAIIVTYTECSKHADAMRLRYIANIKYEDIAERVDYDLSHVYKINRKMLKKIKDAIKCQK